MMQKQPQLDTKNLIIALILSSAILFTWHVTYEMPRQQEAARLAALAPKPEPVVSLPQQAAVQASTGSDMRAEAAKQAGRVRINSEKLHGSLSLLGARFDSLTLAKYRTELDRSSPEVELLASAEKNDAYFAEFGWSSQDKSLRLPDSNTVWHADHTELTPTRPVTLQWDNGQGQNFILRISMDEHYLFTLEQQVQNKTASAISVLPYAYINRKHSTEASPYAILHEGAIAVANGTLTEVDYSQLLEDSEEKKEHRFNNVRGWFGISDKYWLTALIPPQDSTVNSSFSYYKSNNADRFQVDYMGAPVQVPANGMSSNTTRFFAGAKELRVLDGYSKQYGITLFDRAVDFGRLYFLTKPLFQLLEYFYSLIGNFGLAIMLLTVFVKLVMFPLANKSYKSMGQMKRVQPEMTKLREQYADDKMRMNQEIMALYKREKVNPAAGCLPLLIQIPVFFALYKVLFVSIEMRHAPFFGWIQDLSAPDPLNIFTLFGLVPWNAPHLLHVGIWPVIMSVTMALQQRMNPAPADPVQAKILAWLPVIFLFLFASFPAGLVIYWAWSNILSIAQQWLITRKLNPPHKAQPSPAE